MKREFATVGGHYLDTFTDEARIGAQLDHPNLVHVRDFVVEHVPYGNAYCQIMEWIDGLDLRTLIQTEHKAGRDLPWELVAAIGISVLHGLSAAHERKL